VIAAKLGVTAAEVERVAAGLLPNPVFSYSVGNLTIGGGTVNCVNQPSPANPTCEQEGFASNLVHSLSLSWELEVWGKRHLRVEAARAGIEAARAQLQDALRTVAAAVTVA